MSEGTWMLPEFEDIHGDIGQLRLAVNALRERVERLEGWRARQEDTVTMTPVPVFGGADYDH